MAVDLFRSSCALQYQNNGAPRGADINRFVGSIQNKHRRVHCRVTSLGVIVVRTECSVTLHWRNPQSRRACIASPPTLCSPQLRGMPRRCTRLPCSGPGENESDDVDVNDEPYELFESESASESSALLSGSPN